MIVVKVELWPKGVERLKRELGRMTLSNVGVSANGKRGDYDIKLMRKGTKDKVQRTAGISGYPRESYPVWELVRLALNQIYGRG